MRPLLSICLTAYKQTALVEKWLEETSKCDNREVEIIVSDQTEDKSIEQVVSRYKSANIRYFHTESNGHDLNIINAIREARGKYIYIFRSKDYIIHENISNVIKTIKKHPEVGYFAFSALFPDGRGRMLFKDRVYKKGKDAAKIHSKLFIHPSGNLYKRELLDTNLYEKYQKKYFDNNLGFTVHQLIRMDLINKCDFYTSSVKAWVYEDTLKSEYVAQNKGKNRENIYSPMYQYPRYRCEFDFAFYEIKNDYRKVITSSIVNRYYYAITYGFELINNNPKQHEHYQSSKKDFSYIEEGKTFRDYTDNLIKELPDDERLFIKRKMLMTTFLLNSKGYSLIHFIYRNTLIRNAYRFYLKFR